MPEIPDLKTAGIIVGIVAGVGALILGIWNRIEQWRDRKTKRSASKPHFEVWPSPHADNSGWRPMQFRFYNPADQAFVVDAITIKKGTIQIAPVRDPGVGLVEYGGIGSAPDTSRIGITVSAGWTIAAGAGASTSPTHRVFWKSEFNPISFSIRVTAHEISASRRVFHMDADATVSTPAP
jgi:hypothetical protein